MSVAKVETKSTILMSDRAAELEERAVARLRTVHDPEIPVNIYDLGLIYDIKFKPALTDRFDVHVLMTLTTPNCPVAGQMPAMVEKALRDMPELMKIDVQLTFNPPWDKSRMTDEAKLQLNMF